MKQTMIDLVGVAGLSALAWGVREIYEPAAFVVVGAVLMGWALAASRKA